MAVGSERQVYLYRPREPVRVLENPGTISGESVLPGFVLDRREVWWFWRTHLGKVTYGY